MNVIEIRKWNDEPSLRLILEAEAIEFVLETDEDYFTFEAVDTNDDFKWTLKYSLNYIQIYPESRFKNSINVYKNGCLIF